MKNLNLCADFIIFRKDFWVYFWLFRSFALILCWFLVNIGMRKLLLLFAPLTVLCVVCIAFAGCSDKKSAKDVVPEPLDVSPEDSFLSDSSFDEIITETPMPKAAEVLFDDFIFNYAVNKKLQVQRTVFPLPVITNGDTVKTSKEEWTMENFFMHQEMYTLIFDNQQSMDNSKSTDINHAVVEKIHLDKNTVEQFHFDRQNGEWLMTEIEKTSIEDNTNASFLKFYKHFVEDPEFQIESINEELSFSGPDPDDDFSTMEGILVPEQWPSFAPSYLPTGLIYNIKYGETTVGSNQKIFVIRGISNGFETEMTFQKKQGKWYLCKLNT